MKDFITFSTVSFRWYVPTFRINLYLQFEIFSFWETAPRRTCNKSFLILHLTFQDEIWQQSPIKVAARARRTETTVVRL
jgi:hypothetical protein